MAVLPFRSLTNDGEYLGLGMADALITRLGRTKLLLVRSTGAVQKYTVPGLDPVTAGRDLQVDSVLEGSIQKAGDRLRTTVRLLRVSDGSTLWAATFDERLTDIFSVQDSISQREGQPKTDGIAAGEQVGAGILDLPTDDGLNNTVPYVQPPPGPGVYEPTANATPLGTKLPLVVPLALEAASQFRPDGPSPLSSEEYAADLELECQPLE